MNNLTKNLKAGIARTIAICMILTYFLGNADFAKAAINLAATAVAVNTEATVLPENSDQFDSSNLSALSSGTVLAVLDYPQEMENVNNTVTVSGWAVSQNTGNAIGSIVVEIGGTTKTAERFYRPDVESALGGGYDFSLCGYTADIDISELEAGNTYALTVNFMDSANSTVLGSLSRNVVKVTSEAKPFIACLDSPAESQAVNGSVTVSGWALYTLDGVINNIGRVDISVASRVTPANLYIRDDVKIALPGYGDYENSAFSAQVDISGLTGALTLEVLIYDRSGNLLHTFTRTVICGIAPKPYTSMLDTPIEELRFTDSIDVSGWALYTEDGLTNDIESVKLQLAEISQDAELGVREDVKAAINGYGDYQNSGFTATINTSRLAAGRYTLYVYIYGKDGIFLGEHSRNIIKENGGSGGGNEFIMASAGLYHSMGLKSDGSVWTWGDNFHGQLGDGTVKESLIPKRVFENAVSVSASLYCSSYAIKQDGTLWAWGNNHYGKLGNGAANSTWLPVMVMENVVSVSAGSDHAAAITQDGTLWAWGNNWYSQLGTGDETDASYVPVKVMEDVKFVSSGDNYTMAVKKDGSLWAWGNNNGQFGNGTTDKSAVPIKIMDGVASVSTGGRHAMIIKEDSSLWLCGSNYDGQLGNGNSTGEQSLTPVKIMDNVLSASAGWHFSTAITHDGSLWTWGSNSNGELGDGKNSNNRNIPESVLNDVVYCSAGANYALAIKSDGNLWAWGNNVYGQLGNGLSAYNLTPVEIMSDVVFTSSGDSYTAAIKSDGSLWLWGKNSGGQLGNNTHEKSSVPVKILDNVVSVSTGSDHAAAILSDGSLWTWGINYSGQLGNDTFMSSSIPVKVMDDVSFVSAGADNTAAVKTDGSLWVWGNNYYGKLGNGTVDNQISPVKIMDNISSVSLGRYHTAAIGTDGSIWTWGNNNYGQLGDGTTTDSLIPIKVMESASSVSVGWDYTMAVKSDGSLWAWGSNLYGQLGRSDISYSGVTIPEKIIDSGVISVKTSSNASTFAIFSDTSLWAWGDNFNGQLGDGTSRNERRTPVKIMDNVSEVSAGYDHSSAIANGIMYTWGYNYYSQLGNGYAIEIRTPVLITTEQ